MTVLLPDIKTSTVDRMPITFCEYASLPSALLRYETVNDTHRI